ncbi:OLC1v1025077C1 [Oldenlandia corymbosa var. corymbosa]|uniref:Formin-like protein n=1 Tax=Oldenlandia corymbosa var. corymbosa TaxID=529605 RepID=A0AAV1C3V5_OLDCO|nr:OLC1v1025077C1 [Oldenlandia corymbosa var. corymbosa]
MEVGTAQTIIFVAFLWVLVSSNSNGDKKFAEATVSIGFSLDIQPIHDETANENLIYCSRYLNYCIQCLESLEQVSLTSSRHGNGNLDFDQLALGIIEEIAPHSPFQEKKYLFECLRKEMVFDHESGEDLYSDNWFNKCQEPFSTCPTVPRRFLRHRRQDRKRVKHGQAPSSRALSPDNSQALHENKVRLGQAPASIAASPDHSQALHRKTVRLGPAPASRAASPDYSPAPTYFVPASSPSPLLQPPSPVLRPPSPEPSPPQGIIKPRPYSGASDPPPKRPIHEMAPPPRPQSSVVSTFQKYETAIIVAGSVVGLALVVLLVFCCINRKKDQVSPVNGQTHVKRDEKPLLNFSASDVSAASSQMSQSLGNYGDKNLNTSSAIGNGAIAVDSSAETKSATPDASVNTTGLLPLPPGRSAPPPAAPPPPPPKPPAPAPPPPPKVVRPPPNPPKGPKPAKPSPLGGHTPGKPSAGDGIEMAGDSDAPKAKLKPFFWEKVMANPDHSMVWNEIKAGSFQFNEEMMESLFGYVPADKGKYEHNRGTSSSEAGPMYIQIIDPKKSQNLAILLKALNVTTEEVCDALKEGNELPPELVETLLRVAPTTEEELKLRLFSGDLSQLGPAERFLKVIVDIPFAFKRMESLLFMSSFQDETSSIAESFATLEVACKELRNSRLFLKLLEAVLKTGNRMNDGTYRGGAMAFKLDTLLKLSDVKGTDGKTTLLHFVVQEIIRSEGLRAARRLRESQSMSSVKTEDLAEESSQESADYHRSLGLEVVSGLSNDLVNVRKAALIDGDILAGSVSSLGQSLLDTKNFLNCEMRDVQEDSEFCSTLSSFIEQAEVESAKLLEEEKRIMALVKSTGDYFHGNAGKDEGLRLFVIVRDFLIMLDKACKDVKNQTKLPAKTSRREALAPSPSQESHQESLPDLHHRLFPAIKERRLDDSSSDDDN